MNATIRERAKVGQADFESFYRAQYPQVYRAVHLTTGDPELAFDATQEAFKRAYARWWRLGERQWAGGWVMTTALNASKRMGRKAAREVPGETDRLDSHPSPNPHRVDVASALQQLGARQRVATVLFYLGDVPIPAIAEVMGVSEGTVKAHLAQARKKLRQVLEVHDV
jgi:RNA polymerase sigma-70 factor (ECF subfamily)